MTYLESDSALNLVGTEASGTSVHMARSSVDNGLDPLHIGLPSTIGTSVGVGNLDTEGNALTTIITLRHHCTSYPHVDSINYAFRRRLNMIADFPQKSKHFFTKF